LTLLEVMAMKRPDGRTGDMIRPMSVEQRLLHEADGSARWSQGSCSVLAGVFGPIEAKQAKENYSKAIVDVEVKPPVGAGTMEMKELERAVAKTLSPSIRASNYPRMAFKIVIQLLAVDGSVCHTFVCIVCVCVRTHPWHVFSFLPAL